MLLTWCSVSFFPGVSTLPGSVFVELFVHLALQTGRGLEPSHKPEVLVALRWSMCAMQTSTSTPVGPHSTAVLVASLGMHYFPHRKRWPRTGSEMLDVHCNKSLSLWTWMSQSAVVHYHLSHYFANIWISARIHQHISGFQECQEFIPAVH